LTGIYFGGSKTVKKRIPEDFFFPVFSGGIFHRNVVLEGVSGIPVFCCFYRIFFAGIPAGQELGKLYVTVLKSYIRFYICSNLLK
jgi:hypothetical protein